jgi:hypothetical protein
LQRLFSSALEVHEGVLKSKASSTFEPRFIQENEEKMMKVVCKACVKQRVR